MKLAEELKARGFIQECSADPERIFAETRTVYIGSDPTADSLHVGHLAWVMLMKRLADAGHKVILLVGGGTGMIGDPKEKGERVLMDTADIDRNASALEAQLSKLLGQESGLLMVNNAEWLREVKLLEFLRDIGKHFTVNDLIKRDLIRRRLDNPDDSISYTEFTYSLLQAYDFRELHHRYNCDLQVGASDQWTNILSGVDLIRKKDGQEVFALAIPLITDAGGRKFGKSEGNAVWLDAQKTTPYEFYQFWLNVDDTKVADYLNIYTLLPMEEVASLVAEHQTDPSKRLAQRRLAELVTTFVHGEKSLETVELVSHVLFGDSSLSDLNARELEALKAYAPKYLVPTDEKLVDIMVHSGLASSKREAREFISGNAVTLGGTKLSDGEAPIEFAEMTVLKRGKKNAVLLIKE